MCKFSFISIIFYFWFLKFAGSIVDINYYKEFFFTKQNEQLKIVPGIKQTHIEPNNSKNNVDATCGKDDFQTHGHGIKTLLSGKIQKCGNLKEI